MKFIVLSVVVIAAAIACLTVWRMMDQRADRRMIDTLYHATDRTQGTFDPAMVADLPDPARRFFTYAIEPGTPLRPTVTLDMRGKLHLGTQDAHQTVDMQATQVLAAPHGFIWSLDGRMNGLSVTGSDSGSWTRFWVGSLVPVARAGGTDDHRLSAFGRYVAEAVFWSPAAVLPAPHVRWDPVDDSTAKVTMTHDGMEQSILLRVAPSGEPIEGWLTRWSNVNDSKTFTYQPFGGTLSGFQTFDGYRIPTVVKAGNFFGTDDYFPFFDVTITGATFHP